MVLQPTYWMGLHLRDTPRHNSLTQKFANKQLSSVICRLRKEQDAGAGAGAGVEAGSGAGAGAGRAAGAGAGSGAGVGCGHNVVISKLNIHTEGERVVILERTTKVWSYAC